MSQQIEQLRKQILEFNRQYEAGTPIVEDAVYDFYKKKLSILEADSRYKISDVIGNTPSEHKAKHLQKILSLQHDFGKQTFCDFVARIEKKASCLNSSDTRLKTERADTFPFPLIAELKVDGVSVVARYEHGKLQRLATRGDGVFGEDITHLAKFLNLPNEIYIKQLVELRFEAYIQKDILKNPRNAVAGLLLKKDADENLKYIHFMPHNLYASSHEEAYHIWPTYLDLRSIFERMHLDLLSYYKVCHSIEDMEEFFDDIEKQKDGLSFEIDGVVFKVNDHSTYPTLGETATAPRYAFAVKFENTFAISTITDIKFQVGRFGRLTPIAEIEETDIKGRKIRRATLNNIDALKAKQYAIGDVVRVEMAGEVIPMITTIIEKTGQIVALPETCPSCSSFLQEDFCINDWNCLAQRKERLCYFASKHGLDISGMGEKQIEFFMQMNMLAYPYDFFEIKNKVNMITHNPSWMGEKALANLLESIEKSRYKSLSSFIISLGMLHIGRAKAELIADKFPNFRDFLSASVEQLQFLGPEIAKDVYIYKQQPWIAKTFDYMRDGEYKTDTISLF